MSSSKSTGVTPDVPDQPIESLPIANLISADEIPEPEIKPWKYQDLAEKKVVEKPVVDEAEKAKIRQEMQPELLKEIEALKKETIEKSEKEGYEVGLKQGIEVGTKQAYDSVEEEAQQLLSAQVKSIQNLLEALSEPYQLISQSVFESLSRLTIEMASRVVEMEVQQHHDWILKAIKEAIATLPEDSEHLDIQIHPDDLEVVEKYQQSHSTKWRIIADSDLPKGSCRVKHKSSVVINDWQLRLKSFLEETDTLVSKLAIEPDPLIESSNPASSVND